MPDKEKSSPETSSGSDKLGIIDDIKKTINEITSGIRSKIASVFGGLGNLFKKGLEKLMGKKEEKKPEEDKPEIAEEPPQETQTEQQPEQQEEERPNPVKLKLESLSTTIENLKSSETIDEEGHRKLTTTLAEAKTLLETENPDTEKIAEKLTDIAEKTFELIKSKKLSIKQGDITEQKTYAIVNAANTDLQLGGGVAGAIKAKGGEKVQEECDKATEGGKKIEIGTVVVTHGGELKNKIIHAPVMDLGGQSSPENIRLATVAIIKKAAKDNIKTIAIPALGAGAGQVSIEESAKAIKAGLIDAVEDLVSIKGITFVLHDEEKKKAFLKEFNLQNLRPVPVDTEEENTQETEAEAA